MSKNLNKKSESVIKANSTKKTGTKKQYRNRNTYPLTNENLNIFNFANDTTSESYNTSNSSDLNDESDDDAETVITDYASNPYGLTTPSPAPNDEMDVDDYEPPATELLTREGKKMFYIINDKLEPVTNSNYNRNMTIYDINRNIIPRGQHLPESRIINEEIMEEDIKIGGKRLRKTHRKTKRNMKRNTKRNTKRKKTRRHRRRNTRKYK
jgi:hypothetical protein